MRVTVHRIAMGNPADVRGLMQLIEIGEVDPSLVVAIIGKTEGNGGANDFTRALATVSTAQAIATVTGESPGDVVDRVALVWSGGCEGVLSPHMTVICRDDSIASDGPGGGLAVSVQRTRDLRPEEIGTLDRIRGGRWGDSSRHARPLHRGPG